MMFLSFIFLFVSDSDLSLVSDISNEAILVVSVVGHNLHTAVRKLDWNRLIQHNVIVIEAYC